MIFEWNSVVVHVELLSRYQHPLPDVQISRVLTLLQCQKSLQTSVVYIPTISVTLVSFGLHCESIKHFCLYLKNEFICLITGNGFRQNSLTVVGRQLWYCLQQQLTRRFLHESWTVNSTFMRPCIVNLFKHNQQGATLRSGIYYCFLPLAVGSSKSSTITRCRVYSFELLMMGGGTAWNM